MIRGRKRGEVSISGAASALACLAFAAALALPDALRAEEPVAPNQPSVNLYGMTGLIDMPSAEMQPDAQFTITSSFFGGYLRNTISVQILPGLETAFRYSVLDNMLASASGTTLYDRSFDLKLRLIREAPNWPSVVIGLQDFLGTGVYSGEYFAATKNFVGGDLKLTGGIGWGRFAGTSGVGNPLCTASDRFCDRTPSVGVGGTVDVGQFFSGDEMGVESLATGATSRSLCYAD